MQGSFSTNLCSTSGLFVFEPVNQFHNFFVLWNIVVPTVEMTYLSSTLSGCPRGFSNITVLGLVRVEWLEDASHLYVCVMHTLKLCMLCSTGCVWQNWKSFVLSDDPKKVCLIITTERWEVGVNILVQSIWTAAFLVSDA